MDVFLSIVLMVLTASVPLKMAASWLGARRNSYGACVLTTIIAYFGGEVVRSFFEKGIVGFVVAVLVVGVISGVVLQTSLWNGIKINFVAMLLTLLLLPVFVGFVAMISVFFR